MLRFSKTLLLGIFFSLLLIPFTNNNAEAAGDTVYFFYGDGCPHCAKEEIFLEDLQEQDPSISIEYFEVWNDRDNLNLLKDTIKALDADIDSVPFTLVGTKYVSGFHSVEVTGIQIKNNIELCQASGDCIDVVSAVKEGNLDVLKELEQTKEDFVIPEAPEKIKVPFIGEVNLKSVSLPVLTIIMGGLDGFNPCAMWVLIFLIGLLVGMENKRRRWTLGIVFLVTSAGVYYIFMAAWLNLLLFLGVVLWVRLLIGALALGGGAINIREYFKNPNAACKVTQPTKRKMIFNKLREITLKQQLWLALLGIIILAFAVNLVELICSAGLPAVYTQVLALADLATWQYYGYIFLYILIFLIDDIIVFVIAMVTLEVTGLSSKYSRYSSLIGGIIMLIIGLLLVFKPEWLMFG